VLNEVLKERNVILGSESPRRRALLKGLDIEFEAISINADETFSNTLKLEEVPEFLARKKSKSFQRDLLEKELLITADTVVILGEQILNKPRDKAEAKSMLSSLSGNTHRVITGVCLTSLKGQHSFRDETKVSFSQLNEAEIDYYLNHYKPYDKAGSYGIQEWIGYVAIDSMNGCFYNVMGLPLPKLYQALKTIKI